MWKKPLYHFPPSHWYLCLGRTTASHKGDLLEDKELGSYYITHNNNTIPFVFFCAYLTIPYYMLHGLSKTTLTKHIIPKYTVKNNNRISDSKKIYNKFFYTQSAIKSGIFHLDQPNFVSHSANLNVKNDYIMVPRELRWCDRCWLIWSHCLCSISIASLIRRLKVLLSVTRTVVLLESTKWPVRWQCSRTADEFLERYSFTQVSNSREVLQWMS